MQLAATRAAADVARVLETALARGEISMEDLFDDRVGHTCGRHDEPFKLQAYRRDTGERMFDMSVPIAVGGDHGGGFRIGYRIE